MSSPRALVVCGQAPGRHAPQAGHKTAYKYLSELARTHAIDLLIGCKSSDVPAGGADDDLRRVAASVEFVPVSRLGLAVALCTGLLDGLAPRFASRRSARLREAFRGRLGRSRPDLVWLEFSQCFWLIDDVPAGIPVVLSAHDIQTQVVASKGGWELATLLGATFRSERRFLERADRVRVQSSKDAALLASFFRLPSERIEVAQPALSAFLDKLTRTAETIEPHSILFWGAMGRAENAEAVLEFARADFVRLRERHPAAHLYIVGSGPTPAIRALASEAITVTGFVDDPSGYFARCGLGIAPLTLGAGIKVKVLEMLQARMPVVSTPIGAEGIEGNPLLTVVARRDFAEAILAVWQ